ncbi:MAG: hypothetical protein RLZZ453_462 [Chlamydiota bacterium]|jgi:antitoxin component YwqK of YwqJK toxin-antitoxin module
MKKYFVALLLLASCAYKAEDRSQTVISMQTIDRNGFTETISNKERLSSFKATDFLSAQPFQKVLRVYGKNANGQTTSKITTYHDNGGLCQYLEATDGRAHGIYREWFPSGTLHIEACLIEGVADVHELAQNTWVFDDKCSVWDTSGHLVALFQYKKGLLVDRSLSFFPDGGIQQITPYELGLIHGAVQTFAKDQSLIEEVHYEKGIKQGQAIAFWEANKRRYEETYVLGKLHSGLYFDPEGILIAEVKEGSGKQALFNDKTLSTLVTISNGIVEGEITEFNPNGTIKSIYHLIDGKKHGEEKEYYPHEKGAKAQVKLLLNWNEDKIQGIVKTWYPSGQLESQKEVLDNKKQGSFFAWYKNGDLMLTEEYENDLLIKGAYYQKGDKVAVSKIDAGKGVAHLHNADGIFLKKVPYDKGKPLL